MRLKKLPPCPSLPVKRVGLKYVLNEEQEEWLRKVFPEFENYRIMDEIGLKFATFHRIARDLGLKKSEEGLKGIMHRTAQKAKRTSEKNGYYDSMRRRGISKECLEGFKRYAKSDRYVHPLKVMKAKNPKKYEAFMRKKSQDRKKRMAEEKKRIMLGLPRMTKMCIVERKYTRREIHRRYFALKYGYSVGYPFGNERMMIFYNDETERHPLFEKNAIKDGFVIMPEDAEVKAIHDYYNTGLIAN